MNSRARGPVVAKHTDAALRRYLKNAKMSQAQFGKMGGWSAPTVSRWFKGEFPTNAQQALIAKITNGEVMPNDWYLGLPNGEPVELTTRQVDELRAGKTVKLRINRRSVEITLAAGKEP